MTQRDAAEWMDLALRLGRRGLGLTWPNPAVGCVIVKDGRIVGRGTTAPGGRPHAERVALAQAGSLARGACVYVTLEPCAHHGKSAPCVDALIAAQVRRVVYALDDPDPRVNGRGLARLRDAGIAVSQASSTKQARQDHIGFLTRIAKGRPFVTLKLASSFDGRIATASGHSKWITGPLARHFVHGLRNSHDAILVGGGTARTDNPRLTVRGWGKSAPRIRIVASRGLRLPLDGALAKSAHEAPLWLVHGNRKGDTKADLRSAWRELGAHLLPVGIAAGGQLDPIAMLEKLGEAGLTRVFCEGGGSLAAALLQADLVDELVGVTAGIALGAEGRPAIGALGIDRLDQAPRFALRRAERLGQDVVHIWSRSPLRAWLGSA